MRKTITLIAIGVMLGLLTAAADFTRRRVFAARSQPTVQIMFPQVTASPTLIRPTATRTPTVIVQTAVPTITATPQPTATAVVIVPTAVPEEVVHVVQAGDTFYTIATQYSITMELLAMVNQRTLTDFLYVGEELRIPSPDFKPIVGAAAVVTNTFPFDFTIPADAPTSINGIAYSDVLLLSSAAVGHVREIYALGQSLGRNPQAFAKVGDSTVENDHFLSRFDQPELGYELADYGYLQRVIDYYDGSFNRDSTAVRIGLHAWTMFDPQWADIGRCEPNEAPLKCEIRLHNPAIVLIRIGSNDVGVPEYYEASLRQIVEYCLAQGVIPIMGTKADRNDGADNPNNLIIRKLAAEYELPLWDYDRLADTLPGRGLDEDGIHMNVYYQHDYSDPIAYERGHAMHNLTALVVLDLLTQIVGK